MIKKHFVKAKELRVLLFENKFDSRVSVSSLMTRGFEVEKVNSLSAAKAALKKVQFDILLMDHSSFGDEMQGTLSKMNPADIGLPVVLVFSENSKSIDCQKIRAQISDYVLKDKSLNDELLSRVIHYSIERYCNSCALKSSEKSLDFTQKIAKMGSWKWYPESDIFQPTGAFLKIFGRNGLKKGGSFVGFLQNVVPEDRKKITHTLRINQLRHDPIHLEFRIFTKDKVLKHILMRGNLVQENGRDEPMYYGTGQDITDLKTTHENLNQRERFLDMTGEIASVGGWEIDLEAKKVFWTRATYAIHEESVSRDIDRQIAISYYSEEAQDEIRNLLEDSIRTKSSFSYEKKIRTKSGIEKWVYCKGRPVFQNDIPVKVTGIMQDVTESRDQLEELRIRAMMLDNVGEAAIAVDTDWKIIFWNKGAERLFKYKKSEVIGRTTEELKLAKLSKATIRKILSLLKRGQSYSDELMMIDRNGREFPVWASNSPVYDDAGNVCALLNISRDISKEKTYLKQIKDSEERFRKLFEYSPLGKGLTDMNTGKWIDCNKTFTRLLGYSKKELKNLTVQDITPNEYQKVDKREMGKLSKSGAFGPYQKAYLKKDGSLLKTLITGFVVADEEGGKKAWSHVLDLTELEQKTEALNQSEERFKEYIENASDVFLTTDMNGILTYISPNIESMLGYKPKEVLGKYIFQFVHPDDAENLNANFPETGDNIGEEKRVTYRFMHKEGNYKYVQGQGSMRQRSSGEIYGLIIARDIDNERNVEIHVREQNRKLKDIAFIQSHIVRRPLANILGLLAINGMNEGMPDEALRLIDLIKKEAEIMDQIVEEIVEKSTEITNLPNYEE